MSILNKRHFKFQMVGFLFFSERFSKFEQKKTETKKEQKINLNYYNL